MDNKNSSISLPTAAVLAGLGLVLVGFGWLLFLAVRAPEPQFGAATRPMPAEVGAESAPTAQAPRPAPPVATESGSEPTTAPSSEPTSAPATPTAIADPEDDVDAATRRWAVQELDDSDLGSGSVEFSAVTLNEQSNRLMVADDGNRLFEFELAADGTPVAPPRRAIRVNAGAGDIEGIAWMFANTYVIAHEDDGYLTVVEIGDDTTTLTEDDVVRTIDTGIREIDGNGLEGVAYLGLISDEVEFVVVDERPATLVLLSSEGTVVSSLELGLPDASDVWATSAGLISVLSDEGRAVVDLRIVGDGTIEIVDRLSLVLPDGQFEQPEGLVQDRASTRLYVVGEAPSRSRYSFGLWTSELVADG